MTAEEYYRMKIKERQDASKLAREVASAARERGVRIPLLIGVLCEEYAYGESLIAEDGAYRNGFSKGVSEGRAAERRGE